jgi:hypothetical protein
VGVAVAVAACAFVFVPAFPEPGTFIPSDYSALQKRLGPPTVVFGDKFVGWAQSRAVATWTLEVHLDFPLEPGSRTHAVARCLWIQWAGYSMMCTYAFAETPSPGATHDGEASARE